MRLLSSFLSLFRWFFCHLWMAPWQGLTHNLLCCIISIFENLYLRYFKREQLLIEEARLMWWGSIHVLRNHLQGWVGWSESGKFCFVSVLHLCFHKGGERRGCQKVWKLANVIHGWSLRLYAGFWGEMQFEDCWMRSIANGLWLFCLISHSCSRNNLWWYLFLSEHWV